MTDRARAPFVTHGSSGLVHLSQLHPVTPVPLSLAGSASPSTVLGGEDIFCRIGMPVRAVGASTLGVVVPHMRGLWQWLKVRGIATRSRRASAFIDVVKVKPIGDRADKQLVRDTMGDDQSSPDSHSAITRGQSVADKGPTGIKPAAAIDLGPETLDVFWGKLLAHCTTLRVMPRPRPYQRREGISFVQLYQFRQGV